MGCILLGQYLCLQGRHCCQHPAIGFASGGCRRHCVPSSWTNAELRNLLTGFARKEDIQALWVEAGETEESAGRIIDGHSLTPEVASIYERDFELPLPYYIDFGRHFFLLPMFGGLMNAHAGMVSYLIPVPLNFDR